MSFVISQDPGTVFTISSPSALAKGLAGGGVEQSPQILAFASQAFDATTVQAGTVLPSLIIPEGLDIPPNIAAGNPAAGGQYPVLGGVDNTFNVVMPGGEVANLVVTGSGTYVNITGAANIQVTNSGGGGAIIETPNATTDAGAKDINLTNAFAGPTDNPVSVNLTALVGNNFGTGQVTIAQAAGGQGGNYLFYAHGGAGNDLIVGSGSNDFIRGGGGDDSINANGGDDLVRGGAGSDFVDLGAGSDTLYYTLDQVSYGDVTISSVYTDTVTDFTAGADKVSFGPAFGLTDDSNKVTGIGTNTLTIANNGKEVGKVISGKDAFNASDINFI